MDIEPSPPTAKGSPEWFTGEVWIDTIAPAQDAPVTVGAVHFAPGARSAWHCHAISQTLYVTEGQGRTQSRGQPAVTIRPGDIVCAPGREWHWHGAAPGTS